MSVAELSSSQVGPPADPGASADTSPARAGGRARYDIRPVETDDAELKRVAELFAVVWPTMPHLTPAYLKWLYADNPRGKVIGFNAWCDRELAGHYVVIPFSADLHGTRVSAALSLNTAVHPNHQGKGLFTKLARQTYDRAAEIGVDHVVGVANANSTPGFTRKLSFHIVARLDARVMWRWPKPVRSNAPTSSVWSRVWEPDDLRWRVRNPSARYSVRVCGNTRWILAPTPKRGVVAVLKTDHINSGAEAELNLPRARRAGVKLWLGHGASVAFPCCGGVPFPERLRPSPLNLIVRSLQPDNARLDTTSMTFEAIDFDAF